MEAKTMQESELSPIHPMRPSNRDLRLHALSLQVATAYRELYEATLEDHGNLEAANELLDAFRAVRRPIGIGPDGKRWGHHAASRAMQGNV